MNATLSQASFAAGELSPALRARTDLAKYRVGVALMRNYFTLPTGGAASRTGSKAILRSKHLVAQLPKPRIVPFTFSVTQTYMLEFGYDGSNGYLRVIKNGGYVLETGQSITSITTGATTTINKVAHGYSDGDWIWFSTVLGAKQLNSSPGFVGVVANKTLNTFEIQTIDGAAISSVAWGAFVSGTMARVYTAALPAGVGSKIDTLKFTQNADTLTICAQLTPNIFNLTRTSDTSWTFTAVTFAPTVKKPTTLAATRNTAGSLFYFYQVSAVYDATGEESAPTAGFSNVTGSAALNQDTGVSMSVTWAAPGSGPTPDRYNVYKARPLVGGLTSPTIFGYCGQSLNLGFVDTNVDPDFSRGPVKEFDIFSSYGQPACSTYFGGRQWFASTVNYPEIVMGSVVANYKNSYAHIPVRADDSVVFSLLSSQVNPIKHLVSLNSLIALCGSGAWLITGDAGGDDAITALSVRARPQIYDGCSDVAPLNVSSDVLYISSAGSKMKTLAYDFQTNLFTGTDITLLASHLFYGMTVTAMAYAAEPFGSVLAVRSDGNMNVMSYLKEQDVYAWSHYDTPGNGGDGVGVDQYVDVASIREGNEDAIYVIVKRKAPGVASGGYYYMIERFASRLWSSGGVVNKDLVSCLDSFIEYSGSPTTSITGLHHMAGATVKVYGDGGMQGNEVVADDGTITIDVAASRVVVGYGYPTQLQTLALDLGDQQSVKGKRKKVSSIAVTMSEARGLNAGPMRDDLSGNSIPDSVFPIRERVSSQTFSSALPFITGTRTLQMTPGYAQDGAVFLQGTEGVPSTILAVTPTVSIGDDNG